MGDQKKFKLVQLCTNVPEFIEIDGKEKKQRICVNTRGFAAHLGDSKRQQFLARVIRPHTSPMETACSLQS